MPLSDDMKSMKQERLIGAIAVRWTHLENAVQHMFWAVAGLDSRIGLCITQHMAFRSLCDAILTICHETPEYNARYSEFKELISEADSLRKERNDQIHALWGVILGEGASKEIESNEVTGFLIKARGKLRSTVVHTTVEAIEYSLEEIENCSRRIHKLYREVAGDVKSPE